MPFAPPPHSPAPPIVPPSARPAPPATTPAPAAISPGGSGRNSSAERQKPISRRVVHRRIRIGRRAIDHGRVVRGDVNDLRIGLLNHDHVLAFDRLTFHFLLLARF